MLILKRKLNERIMIGDDIVITVVKLKGGSVGLGFEAPADVEIQREEIFNLIKRMEAEGVEK